MTENGLVRQLGEMAIQLKSMKTIILCCFIAAILAVLASVFVKVNKTQIIQDSQIDDSLARVLAQQIEDDTDLVLVHEIADLFESKEKRVSKIRFYDGVLHREGSQIGDSVIYIKVYYGLNKDVLYTYSLDGDHQNTLRRLYRTSHEAFHSR